ncbi:MAG: hypothetical protein AVDCRST_MAG67-3264, partial [uncultured Solirubrobacteraceae bacterium]
ESSLRNSSSAALRVRVEPGVPLQAPRLLDRLHGRHPPPVPHRPLAVEPALVCARHARRAGRLVAARRRDLARPALGRAGGALRRPRATRSDGRPAVRLQRRTAPVVGPRDDRRRPDPARHHAARQPRRLLLVLRDGDDRLRGRPVRARRAVHHGQAARRPRRAPRHHARGRGRHPLRRLQPWRQGADRHRRRRRRARRDPQPVDVGCRDRLCRRLLRLRPVAAGRRRDPGDRDHGHGGEHRDDRRRDHRLRRPAPERRLWHRAAGHRVRARDRRLRAHARAGARRARRSRRARARRLRGV